MRNRNSKIRVQVYQVTKAIQREAFLLWPDWTHGKELPKTKKAKEGSSTQRPKYRGANRIATTVPGDPVFRSQRPVRGHDCIGNRADETLNGATVRFF